jgi:LPPG:FO 2-phospho-L-lactate transferase
MIQTAAGELAFQDYFVRQECRPVVTGIRFAGVEEAQPSREVTTAIRQADIIIFCPSNPLVSLDPILALPTLHRMIVASRAFKVAVSPIVGGTALKGPAAKMMSELGLEVSATGVARHFQDALNGFVLDYADEALQDAITDLGLRTLVTATVMKNIEGRVKLAQEVLEFAGAGAA